MTVQDKLIEWLRWISRALGGLSEVFERPSMCPACGEAKEKGHNCNAY